MRVKRRYNFMLQIPGVLIRVLYGNSKLFKKLDWLRGRVAGFVSGSAGKNYLFTILFMVVGRLNRESLKYM